MRMILVLWMSATLWIGSLSIPSINTGTNPYSEPVSDIFIDYTSPETLNKVNSSEEVLENILKSIQNYHASSNKSTHKNPTIDECEDKKRELENLINNIFTSIKNHKENKNYKDTTSNTHQNGSNNPVIINEQSNTSNTPDTVNCTCVKYYLCNDKFDPEAIIVIRDPKYECPDYLQVCCSNIVEVEDTTTTLPVTSTPVTNSETNSQHLKCGLRRTLTNGTEIKDDKNDNDDRARYGEFPWMVWIGDSSGKYVCGGSLIRPKVVLTAAHCVNGKENLVIRVGDWNTQYLTKEDPSQHQELKVRDIIVHEQFNNGSLANDPALLILESSVELSDRVGIICLTEHQETVDGQHCIASGWANQLKSNKSEDIKTVLKRVGPLPIVPRDECQTTLRKTKLGNHFKLHETFICAGGNLGIDTCKGDGGSPLVCPSKTDPNVYIQVGVVAWGISCGTDTPGVYVNVPHFLPWIRDVFNNHAVI